MSPACILVRCSREAAGLVAGYRAGAHWAYRDKLASFGAIAVAERVVKDRNRITGEVSLPALISRLL